MLTTGNNTLTCSANATAAWWSGSPVTCSFPPPTFYAASLTVPEFVPVNTLVGAPLFATINSPNDQVLFQINQVANPTAQYGNINNTFWVSWPVFDDARDLAFIISVAD
jgi:hypothetical protein